MKRKELMRRLNLLLGTDYCWDRINLLDLTRLVKSVDAQYDRILKLIKE